MGLRATPLPVTIGVVCLMLLGAAARRSYAQENKVIYQINCGGPAVGSYAADSYFDGGNRYDNNDAVDAADVPNAPPARVYKYQRYGDFKYAFPNLKPGGDYLVRLHLVEIFFNKDQVGKRVFDVSINRKLVLDHYDIPPKIARSLRNSRRKPTAMGTSELRLTPT